MIRGGPAEQPGAAATPPFIDSSAQVIDTEGHPIPGLFAAGELAGGLFYFNYPGSTGLMSGYSAAAAEVPVRR